MKEAEFDLLFKESSPTPVSDLETRISEDEFDSLFQASDSLTDTIIPAPEPVQTIIPEGMESALDWTTPVPETKPGLLPGPKLNITPSNRSLYPHLTDEQASEHEKVFKFGDILPSLESGYKRTWGNILNLMADKERAYRENPDLYLEKIAGLSPYAALGASMGGLPSYDEAAKLRSQEHEEKLLAEGSKYLKESSDLGRPLTWEETENFSTFLDYLTGLVGQTGPSMLAGMVSMGTASPLLLEAELNAELRQIPDLSSEDQLRLAERGGLIAGALEVVGLGIIARGIPKSLLGKIGVPRITSFVEKQAGKNAATQFAAKVTGRVGVGMAGEGLTETGQEEVLMAHEAAAGKEFTDEEKAHRRKEALAGGMTMGSFARPAIGSLQDVVGKLQESAADKKLKALFDAEAQRVATELFKDKRLVPEPIQKPPIFSEYIPEPVTPVEGGDPEPIFQEVADETTPGLQTKEVSTPPTEAISPTEVQEVTEETEAPLVDEETNIRDDETTLDWIKRNTMENGSLTRGTDYVKHFSEERTDEELIEAYEWTKSDEATPWVQRFVGKALYPIIKGRGYELGYKEDGKEEWRKVEVAEEPVDEAETPVEVADTPVDEGWQDYKNAKGKTLAQIKEIGVAKWWGEEGKPRPIVVRKNKDGIFRVAQFWDTDLTNVTPSELFKNANVPKGTLNKFATEEEATEAAKVFLGETVPETKEVAETPIDEGWQEYTSKGRTPVKIKKIGYWETRSSRNLGKEIYYPIYLKQEANGKFKFAKFIKKSGNLQTITQKDEWEFKLEEVGNVDNSFNSEEEALEALELSREGLSVITTDWYGKPVEMPELDYVPETKEVAETKELPQVEVKEEVTKERQPIYANPDAKEGEPGFKRKAIPGTNREVITPQGNMKGNVNFKIIDLSEAVLAEGELQGRKDRDKSEQALDLIRERAAQFDPIQVTESARTTDSGPPTTLPSGVVISGNGRLLTIKELYENPEYSKQKEAYLEKLNELFPLKKGYSPLAGIKQPVLVQQLNVNKLGKDEKAQFEAIVKFGELSNVPKADTMSVAERAANDAKGVKKIISLFKGSDITSNANAQFVQEFANQNVSATERGEFFTEGSVLSQSGLKRIQSALMTAAFGEDKAIVKYLESTDNDVKAITNAMLDVAPKFSDLQAGIDKGTVPKDMDLAPYLVKALAKISELRQRGVKPAGDLAQEDFLAESEEIRDMFVQAFYHDDMKKARSSKFIGNVLRNYIDKVLEQDYTQGLPSLEEVAKPASATELLDKAITETRNEADTPLFSTHADASSSTKGTDVRKKKTKPGTPKAASPGVDKGGRGRGKTTAKPRTDREEKASRTTIVKWENPEYNASAKEQIFFDLAAIDDTMAPSLSMQERIAIIKNLEPRKLDKLLRKAVKDKFGLKFVEKKEGQNEAALIDSINNMINAYHNFQGMAAVLGLPLKALGLDGTLGLRVEGMVGAGRTKAFFAATSINDPLGPPYISIKGRFNSFAHEWGHALDFFLLNKLGTDWHEGMSGRLRGKSILDEETKERIEPWQATESADKIKYAFGDLLNAMFQEAGGTAAAILDLEGKISRARSDKVIKDYERQLEDLLKGMSKKHLAKSEYFTGAKTQLHKSDYYSMPTEMLARAFESYVSHLIKNQNEGKSSPSNEFLTMPEEAYALKSEDAIDDIIVKEFYKRYPREAERQLIFEKFNTLFEMLQDDLLEGVAANPDKSPMIEWTPLYEQKENKNPFSKEAWLENERELRANQRVFDKTQKQPIKHPEKSRGERWWIKLEDGLIHPWMGTKYGTLLSMRRRYKDKPRAYKAITRIFKKIGIEPGGELNTSNTFPEAVRREVRRLSYVFKTIATRHDAFNFTEQEEKDLRLLLTSDPDTISKARRGEMSRKVVKLSGDLRNLLNKMYHYAKKGEVNIDFLSANAYLPRILDVARVFADQEGFIKNAYNLYSDIIWIDQEGEFDGTQEQLLSIGSIANQNKFKRSNGIELVTPPHLEELVNAYKNVKFMQKEIQKMKDEGKSEEEIIEAENRLEEYMEENQDVISEGYDAIRKDWSVYLASDWNLRIHQMAGEDPSASSPMANFTKKRVMPKEADKYMIDYYTDPIDAIGKYITGVVRKTEYNKRFGRHLIPPGKKRFAPTKQLQDYLDYLIREGMAGEVDPIDVQNMRTDIDAILGRTAPTDMGLKKTLNTVHSYALMGMLTRAVLTSIPEPFVAGIKMRSSLKGLKTFGLTLQEALTYVSKDVEQTVQKRRQVANILGLLDDPSVGEMASNRAGGTMADDPKNQGRMNLWFVRVGLQGLTNAQRRATMAVGFQYLKELSSQYLTPAGVNEDAMADNRKEAELVLMDLGIPKSQIKEFSKYMIDMSVHKGLPDPETLMTKEGDLTTMSELLSVSLGRIVERSIQDPLIGNRPRYAEHPLGKFVYSIQSFNYSFQQNVIVGEGKHIKRLFKEIGGKRAAYHVSQLIGPIAQLYIAHSLVSAFREFLMNRERWEEKKKEDKLGSHIAGLTVSRAGTFGAWDPMVNAYTGLRYQRDLSNFMIGAIGSWYSKPTEDIIKIFSGQTNSPNTTATEERAIRAVYQLVVVPMMVFAVSNPRFLSVLGPLAGPASGLLAMFGTSHTVKKAVSSKAIELIYGSKGDMSRRVRGKRSARKKN